MNNPNQRWARNIANDNPLPSGGFLKAIASAYLNADESNQLILDDAITILRFKYQKYDIPERY